MHVDATALQTVQEKLNTFKGQLQHIFIFESFPILVKPCGAARAFATEVGIVLCAEYAQRVYQVLGDKQKASDALMFTLFHELGHVLLRQWEFPAYENEELADEFATATMTLLGQKERIRAKAEFFAARPAAAESLAKTFRDDRHPLSVQRARNIIRRAKDPQLLRKWQTIFIPRLQTPILEQLSRQPSWVFDRELVRAELATRH